MMFILMSRVGNKWMMMCSRTAHFTYAVHQLGTQRLQVQEVSVIWFLVALVFLVSGHLFSFCDFCIIIFSLTDTHRRWTETHKSRIFKRQVTHTFTVVTKCCLLGSDAICTECSEEPASSSFRNVYRRFGGSYCLHLLKHGGTRFFRSVGTHMQV